MSTSSRDLSIPDGLILFLPAVPGMLFLYIAEVIPKVCAGLGLELGLSGYALLEAVFSGCALSPAAGLPLYCWYFSGGDWGAIRSIRRCSIWPRVLLPFWA